jgi:hypothetical protein
MEQNKNGKLDCERQTRAISVSETHSKVTVLLSETKDTIGIFTITGCIVSEQYSASQYAAPNTPSEYMSGSQSEQRE